jgi:hypothetical protein
MAGSSRIGLLHYVKHWRKMMKVGDRVRTGVYVCGEWKGMYLGIITRRIDAQLVEVDVGSLHGCKPWKHIEQESHLRMEKNDG